MGFRHRFCGAARCLLDHLEGEHSISGLKEDEAKGVLLNPFTYLTFSLEKRANQAALA